ncbi:MAG TPA: molybdopterin-dependent oxidoreductase [Bryobacteraceae bacterium]|nr:molybdopterin-dependent oxidoreductase [Bryobacteraceae bacterium]
MTRRELLVLSGAGLISPRPSRGSGPQNLSYPLSGIDGTITPQDLFFVRDHFSPPRLSLETWQLSVEGRVSRPRKFSFSDVLELPARQVESVLECSGNAAGGSAASNGKWEGVPISFLLEKAGIGRDAAFVELEGADTGRLLAQSPPLPFAQVVPVEKCLDASSLLAYKLNGLFLPPRNGFPARALFPGWYGMTSVKWLRRIVVLSEEDRGSAFHQSGMNRVYNRVIETPEGRKTIPLTSVQVKSAIAWPYEGMNLPAGNHAVWGFSWTGTGEIRDVSVSVDGGRSWNAAKLDSPGGPYRWVRWTFAWNAAPGEYTLMSRAADSMGHQQPLTRDKSRKDVYELNWCLPLRCTVR